MRTLSPNRPPASINGLEPHGYVHVTGNYANAHRSEIETLLQREVGRAHHDSPVARIIAWDEDGTGGLLVTTTTEHLAHRLGRSLRKDLGGELHHGFFHHHKLALVRWRR